MICSENTLLSLPPEKTEDDWWSLPHSPLLGPPGSLPPSGVQGPNVSSLGALANCSVGSRLQTHWVGVRWPWWRMGPQECRKPGTIGGSWTHYFGNKTLSRCWGFRSRYPHWASLIQSFFNYSVPPTFTFASAVTILSFICPLNSPGPSHPEHRLAAGNMEVTSSAASRAPDLFPHPVLMLTP